MGKWCESPANRECVSERGGQKGLRCHLQADGLPRGGGQEQSPIKIMDNPVTKEVTVVWPGTVGVFSAVLAILFTALSTLGVVVSAAMNYQFTEQRMVEHVAAHLGDGRPVLGGYSVPEFLWYFCLGVAIFGVLTGAILWIGGLQLRRKRRLGVSLHKTMMWLLPILVLAIAAENSILRGTIEFRQETIVPQAFDGYRRVLDYLGVIVPLCVGTLYWIFLLVWFVLPSIGRMRPRVVTLR